MAADPTLAIVGTGRLGEALLGGLLGSGWTTPDRVVCTTRRQERVDELVARHGVRGGVDNAEAVAAADVVLLGVKPQVLDEVVTGCAHAFRSDHLVVSLAAGVSTGHLESLLPDEVPVVRVMTNTPVRVDTAMSVLAAGTHATDAHLDLAEQICEQVGAVLRQPEERMDAVTAMSGSGPAYLYLVAESMIDAGVAAGLDEDTARTLTLQTVLGAARMLTETGRARSLQGAMPCTTSTPPPRFASAPTSSATPSVATHTASPPRDAGPVPGRGHVHAVPSRAPRWGADLWPHCHRPGS